MDCTQEEFIALHFELEAGFARKLRMLAKIDRRRHFEADGYLSTVAWYRDACRVSVGTARDHLRMARALPSMPATSAAFRAGELNTPEVRLLTAAWTAHPAAFARDERVLVDSAKGLAPGQLRRVVDHWRQALDHHQALADANAVHRRRRLHVSETFDGAHMVDGLLDREGGATVATALRRRAESLDPDDDRTAAQRRADALVDICRDYLDHGDTPVSGGERPHLLVIADLESLEGRAGYRCELDEAGVIHPETLRRLACDASVCRVLTDPDGMPLDLGRSTRTVAPAQRRALIIRDGGCVYPGCRRPPRWCDAHHRKHWADGGATDLDNLVLLCRRHHRLVHEGQVSLGQELRTRSRSRFARRRRRRAAATAGTAAEP